MTTPVWIPKHPEKSRMWQFMRFIEINYTVSRSLDPADKPRDVEREGDVTDYQHLHQWSVANPSLFWLALTEYFKIKFDTPPTQILNDYHEMLDARWFEGATFNFAQQLLSRDDNHPALISIDEKGRRQVHSYHALRQQVANCAAGLKKAGIETGDRVGGVLPNTPYAVIAMLATASLGAIWSSCSPDFGTPAVVDRLGQLEPKLLFVCDGHEYHGKSHEGLTKIQELCEQIPSLTALVVCPVLKSDLTNLNQPKAITWDDFLQPATHLNFASLAFAHPLYILFSSGTTGKPKCIIHSAGGTLLQHLKELGLHTDIKPHDNLCFYTTCGWMMWNWMVSTLALGATLTVYEGSPTYPDAYRLFDLIEKENITVFGTSAKFISSVEKEGASPIERYQLKHLRCILSTGSPLLPNHYDYVYRHINPDVQLSSISGGTDIVSCFALGNPLLPVYRGELQCVGLGIDLAIFDEEGQAVQATRGELVCRKPFPAMPIGFWNDPDKTSYRHAYYDRFANVWAHGDFAELTEHNGLIIYGRSDATLNPGGVRIGTAEIYHQLESCSEIVESVVISQQWQDDVRIILFVVLKNGLALTDDLQARIRTTIRKNTSPRHVPAKILQVRAIPRTMNGKIVEVAIRQVVHGIEPTNLTSIVNPGALEDFRGRSELRS
jgi:acetoacetyl-CoA synthetase